MANFCSDNTTGFSPEIIEAVRRANDGSAMPYGADPVTARLKARVSEVFETEVEIFPVATGSAANVLSLAPMTPPWGAIYCHPHAHINVDECGAPEFYTGGAKLVGVPGEHGKITPEALETRIVDAGNVHAVQPAAVSITQASEAGTVYRPREIAAISDVAKRHRLGLQMDGARFANALAHLGCSPAEATWKAGVDALALGATKNGAIAAEMVVFFDKKLARDVAFRRKRGGHLFSKMRFLSAQLEAYLENDLWLANARHANEQAARLAEGLGRIPGARFLHPVEANEIFVSLPQATRERLRAEGFQFYDWEGEAPDVIRLVTAFNTDPVSIDRFLEVARRSAA